MMIYKWRCERCMEPVELELPDEGVDLWRNGEAIQRAMPTVTVDEREMFKMNWCADCVTEVYTAIELEELDE
jgi:hypothetical protein